LGIPNDVATPHVVDLLLSKKPRRVYCGARHTAVLTSNGTVYTFGYGLLGQLGHGDNLDSRYPKKLEFPEPIVSLSLKDCITVALTEKREVYQWGGKLPEEEDTHHVYNKPEKICGNLNGRRVLQVAASSHHCVARTKDAVYGT